jgi:hypothetical protein
MDFDEVFDCYQGIVSLNLARRHDIIVDTCPDAAACGGGLARVGLGGSHSRCLDIGGGV